VAFLVPTTDHRLRAKQSLPQRLVETCASCSDRFDWDVVDDRLVRDGALGRYRAALLPEGTVFEADVLARLEAWVQAGGVLLRASSGALETGGNADFRGAFSAGSREVLGPVRADPAWTLELGPGDTGADRRLELRREWPLGVGWRGERDSQAVVRRAERRPAGRRPGADLRAGSRGRAASEAPCPGSANHDQRPVGRAGGPGPHVGLPGHRRARRLARPKPE